MQIIKRNGQVAEFDPDKIYQAILKAAQTVYVLDDTWRQNLAQVTKKVVLDLQDAQVERPTINMIQSLVENRLMEAGFINIAEHSKFSLKHIKNLRIINLSFLCIIYILFYFVKN